MYSRQINAHINAWLLNPYITEHFPLGKQSYHAEQMRTFWEHNVFSQWQKQMPFVIARVDAVPFKIIRTEDIQQLWDTTVCQSQGKAAQTRKKHAMAAEVWEKNWIFFFSQHVTISGFYLKAICLYPKPSHSCKFQPARVTRVETFISCRRCLKYSSRFVFSNR